MINNDIRVNLSELSGEYNIKEAKNLVKIINKKISMSIQRNLDEVKTSAIAKARQHKMNFNIIILNPDGDGNFSIASGSTYQIVANAYFDTPRPNAVLLHKTDDLLKSL